MTSAQDILDSKIKHIREDARSDISSGAVTTAYKGSKEVVLKLLQDSLSTELVCALRYRQNAIIADEIGARIIHDEFSEHAVQELEHAEKFAKRISILGGTPSYDPSTIVERSHADYKEFKADQPEVLERMLEENLIAERIAVATYQEIARYIGDSDPTTRRLFEDVLEQEENHADELAGILSKMKSLSKSGWAESKNRMGNN